MKTTSITRRVGLALALAAGLTLAGGCASQSKGKGVQLAGDERAAEPQARLASDRHDPGNTGIGSLNP